MKPQRQSSRGFTLLELMCAFAILALVTAMITQIWANSIEKAETAIDQRELREVADTLFGRILYEESEHEHGEGHTLDQAYGLWAKLPQAKRDRYAIYRYELEKKLTTVSGSGEVDGDGERMFEVSEDEESSTISDEEEGGEDVKGIQLWRYTMRIFLTESTGDSEPLITLQTYRKPSESALANR